MASKNIVAKGATYNGVESITLSTSPSGTATFYEISDTTAVASDVASGKYFFASDGTYTQGSASGGGGASNIAQGTFTTGSTRTSTGTVSLNYTGSGYPIAVMVYVNGGAYNSGTGGDLTWYNSVNRYDCGLYYMTKSEMPTTPTYLASSTLTQNHGCVAIVYKSSTTEPTSYTRTSNMSVVTYNSSDATTGVNCVRFKEDGQTLSYYVGNGASNTVGLAPSTTYAYIVVYSS